MVTRGLFRSSRMDNRISPTAGRPDVHEAISNMPLQASSGMRVQNGGCAENAFIILYTEAHLRFFQGAFLAQRVLMGAVSQRIKFEGTLFPPLHHCISKELQRLKLASGCFERELLPTAEADDGFYRFSILARAASRICRSRGVRLWIP